MWPQCVARGDRTSCSRAWVAQGGRVLGGSPHAPQPTLHGLGIAPWLQKKTQFTQPGERDVRGDETMRRDGGRRESRERHHGAGSFWRRWPVEGDGASFSALEIVHKSTIYSKISTFPLKARPCPHLYMWPL